MERSRISASCDPRSIVMISVVFVCMSVSLPVCLLVCLLVCLFVRLHISNAYLKRHTSKIHKTFCTCYLWPWLGPPSTGIQLPVLWMTSCFLIMDRIGQNQRRRVCFVQFARWRHRGRGFPSHTAYCYYYYYCMHSLHKMRATVTDEVVWSLCVCAV